jgi:aminoglycoside 3-N-acetyltransferase
MMRILDLMANHAPQPQPWTADSLTADLRRLGLQEGGTVLVHASLRALGWVVGAAVSVVLALRATVGDAGTLVVPTHTGTNRDPSRLREPVPDSWWPAIREHLPAFDPAVTPSTGVGVIAEQIRTWPGARRSDHPQTSFAALGPRAEVIVSGHELHSQLGEASPLRRLEDEEAWVLLLGVGFDRCTAFHLAEYRLPEAPMRENSCAMRSSHGRSWVTFSAVALDDGDFAELGDAFEDHSPYVRRGAVGSGLARLFPIREAVTFAQHWIPANRRRTAV